MSINMRAWRRNRQKVKSDTRIIESATAMHRGPRTAEFSPAHRIIPLRNEVDTTITWALDVSREGALPAPDR